MAIKATPGDVIRYWHPRKGGWYHALLVKQGRKWATVEPMIQHNGVLVGPFKRRRIAVADIREALR